jgi:hypothetical protein
MWLQTALMRAKKASTGRADEVAAQALSVFMTTGQVVDVA